MFIKNIKKHFFLKIILPLIALLMLSNAIFGLFKNPKREVVEPQKPVAVSDFKHSVSGLGITEPQSEIINIGVNSSGIVIEIYVKAGDSVKKDASLFTIDNREAKANLELKISQYEAAKLDALDKIQEFEIYQKISDNRAYSKDDFNKKKIAVEIYEQKIKQAAAELEVAQVALDKLTIKAPIDGEVLKVDVRLGEYAQIGALSKSLIMIGDLSKMHVRVEIDEIEASRLDDKKPAFAYLRGNPKVKIPLKFVRFEPYIVPKISLSGGNAEKIDTRVLQVIYSLENNERNKILVGQQMDVYVETDL
jgi:HlyD family secretion protein